MQESCTYGSVRGAPSNGRPYRNRQIGNGFEASSKWGRSTGGPTVSSEQLPASRQTDRVVGRRSAKRHSPPDQVASPRVALSALRAHRFGWIDVWNLPSSSG